MFDGLDASVQALFIPSRDLLKWAGRVRPHLAKMAEGSDGRYETQDFFAALASGRMLMWIAVEGPTIRCVMIGQIENYPRKRTLLLRGLVGDSPFKWRRLLGAVENQARTRFGCSTVEVMHQPRHGILLKGYKTTHWFSEKTL
jgi:hypothetical protein